MNATPRNFDPLARWYLLLERLAFGRDLERARFALLDEVTKASSILILGEGDGRFLEALLPRTTAKIHCIDASAGMIAHAAERIAGRPGCERVQFECADALAYRFVPAHYDAVVTLFFLDCFTAVQVEQLVASIGAAAQPSATWLFADFALPPRGWSRVRARAWLRLLYVFFRWRTGLSARSLPPAEELIQHAGFSPAMTRCFQAGLLRTVLFVR